MIPKFKTSSPRAFALAVMVGFAASAWGADESEDAVSLANLPAKVKATLAKYATESEVKKVVKGDQDGTKVYEFDIEHGTHKFDLAISKKGKYMGQEEDVEFSAFPPAAQTALTAQSAGAKMSGFEKATDKPGKVTYEATFLKSGKPIEVAVDADGKVISTENVTDEKD